MALTPMMKAMSKPARRVAGTPPPFIAAEGIVFIDLSRKPIAFDRGAVAILNDSKALQSNRLTSSCLPPEVLEAVSSLRAADGSAVKAHFQRGRTKYTCRAHLIEPLDEGTQPFIALVFQKDPGGDNAIHAVAPEYDLTPQEQEVLRGITQGLTNKELAVRMDISPNTVKTFLRQIMLKMGVSTRAGVVGKVLNHLE